MNKNKYYKAYCCVSECMNKAKKVSDSELSFHILPKDVERRQEWLRVIDREDLLEEKNKDKAVLVCSAHFDDTAFIITKRLKNDAVPTKVLPQKSYRIQVLPQTSTKPETQRKEYNTTYSHSQSQTETQHQKAPPYDHHKIIRVSTKVPLLMNVTDPTSLPSSSTLSQPNMRILSNKKVTVTETTMTETDFKKTSDKITQTAAALLENTPRKRKIKKELNTVNLKRRRLEQEVEKIERELEAKNASLLTDTEDEVAQRFKKLVEWRNRIKNKFKGNRYDAEYKVFALNLYYASPQAYHCLKTVLKLPSRSTLNRLKLKISPKLDDRVLASLTLKLKSLPGKAKYCTICVDEMVLKRHLYYDISKDKIIGFHNINDIVSPEIASNAYVIMLQGIYCNWKQPIAYALLGSTKHYSELDSWMNEVILKLFGVGIEVKAIISDQGSNFDKYAKMIKNVTIDKPYFFVEEHKIFYIFDVPHLLKCVRNNLLTSDFHYNEEVISWDHITALYEHQKEKKIRLIPKITSAHVEPNNFQRTSVKYAAQIFSNTVYVALETYIDFGIITEKAKPTAKFIKVMDDLFDVLNSSKVKSAKTYQTAFKMSTEQISLLQDAQHMFATIKSTNRKTRKDNTNLIKTFHNFQITIQSILQLFHDLKLEGYNYLFTRRLNQDTLENFFGSIRQQGGSCSEPTPIQFTRAFSKLFYVNMLKSDQSNCESDIYELLLKSEDIMSKPILEDSFEFTPSLVALNGEIDYRVDLPESNALTYVAGFLLFKCFQKHTNCKQLSNNIETLPNLDTTKFSHFKAYNKNKSFYGYLKMPSQEMNEYVNKLETVFTHNFENHLQGNPGSELFKLLKEIEPPTLPCPCFPVEYLLRLFVRLRIFATLKFNNRNFRPGKKSIKQFLKVKQM